eukprot:TRINITY_DN1928_c0_g1_i1.p1 TRINITY_DN1928_c0_g1~~TRINITY_DN1928_c0_g1_i1.p1  ORF type:complete len:314 (-),score=55.86 TRINITY_DN1928_c0_g1_i1:103-1044(-)
MTTSDKMTGKLTRKASSDARMARTGSTDLEPEHVQRERISSPSKRLRQKHRKHQRLFPHSFDARDSILENIKDKYREAPLLENETFQGLVNLAVLMLVAGALQLVLANYMKHGVLVDINWIFCLTSNLFPAILLFPAVTLASFSAFILQKLRISGSVTPSQHSILHYACLLTLMFLPTRLVFLLSPGPIISGAFGITTVIICMKMHSYYATNLLLQKNEQDGKHGSDHESDEDEDKLCYPRNVTLSNYVYFLCVPTLVYEKEYPRTEKIEYLYAAKELAQMAGCFAMAYIGFAQFLLPVIQEEREISTKFLVG